MAQPIPPGFTQHDIQGYLLKYKQMKEQGVRADDPEYLKIAGVLQAVKKQNDFKCKQARQIQQYQQHQQQELQQQREQQQLQQQLQQQQQQHQQQQQQQNGNVPQQVTNGINGQGLNATKSSTPAGKASTPATPGVPNDQHPASAMIQSGQPQKPQVTPQNNFTAEQMNTLRKQILAFKLLSKNLAIPPDVQQQLFASQQSRRPPTLPQAVAAAGQVLTDSETAKLPVDAQAYLTLEPPYTRLLGSISYTDHTFREGRTMLPSIMPAGVDVDRVRQEREIILYNRIMSRKSELEKMKATFTHWDTSKSDSPVPDDSLKLKALIEYKMLCLLPKQRALRQQVTREMIHYDNLAQTANRSMYRRTKKQSFQEARFTEKLEKQQRDARETKEKKKQIDHLQSILQHGAEIQKNAATQKARVQKLGRMMLQHHQHIEKEEQKRVERTAKQRLQALKANDEETYLKLLGQAKDSRISHLLKQTDGFLNQLAASVKAQQRTAAEHYGDEDIPEEDPSDDEDDEEGGPKVDYYQVAHRIKEEIKVQPNILVGGTLKEYQVKGLQWMISLYNNNLNGILADEMGLGKTIQTISLITYLIEKKKQNGPFLVIVPLSTLTNWNLEFEKWAPSVQRVVYKGPPNARKQQQNQIRWGNFQVLLTTYEYIIKDRPVLSKIKWVHMIVDEGHRMKNASSKLSNTLTQYYQTRYRLILTGTPLQNNLPELWALLNFVLPTIFKSVKSFDEWFNTPFANTGGQDKMELTEEEQLLVIRRLHKVLRPFLLRRLKKDVEKDLPNKQERVIKCKFSALQAKLYKQHSLLTTRCLSVMERVAKPACVVLVEEQMNPEKLNNDLLWRTAGKFELLDRVLPKFKSTGHRVLMFFQMTQIMNIMEDFLRLRGMQYLRLDGSTKSDDRSELLKLFNAPDSPYFCFLLSTRAGGLGLNLQTADTVIIYDSDWNPHQDLQAQDRAHRIGQKNEVRILRLISSNSVEEKILERAQYKLDMDGKVIQAGKFDNKSTNEERDALLRTLLDTAEAADQFGEQEEMDDDDLNAIMARSDNELIVFQKIDEERAKDPDYGPDRKYPRLMGESELPDIYLQEDNPVAEEIEEIAGRGARERTRVKYDDGLTEEQWLMAVDDDEDTVEAAIARRNAKIEKRNANKDKRVRKVQGDSSPEPSRESSEAPMPKKRGRKPNVQKRKAEEEIEEAPKRKRGRQSKAVETLSSGERNVLQKLLNSVYQHLMDLEVEIPGESPDEDGPPTRGLIDPFIKLVPRAAYPDYYIVITNPIAMDNIKKKINKEEYQSLKEFRDDIRLLCNNARTYNEDGSLLFQDANDIEAACVAKLKDETQKFPDFQDFDEPTSTPADGRSTAAVSSAGTPLAGAAAPAQKLKLTFNGNKDGYSNGGDSRVQSEDD
ncbi:MAG: RSC complex subunit (Sth1) [Lasallia pustulata]|uniref:RSC complex subunit (Sth1) n=1 Tax=Lasallia pustulata TaxID=136370 RepID=A0A5M8PSR0_9LECA|nr:MAG: RSC complex subunit (Sth1) [Lasallia pustulata]